MLNIWLSGAICMAALTIAVFFCATGAIPATNCSCCSPWPSYRRALHRFLQAWPSISLDGQKIFLLRLVKYGLILVAIIRKNRKRPAGDGAAPARTVSIATAPQH